jgi:hypothetical protein
MHSGKIPSDANIRSELIQFASDGQLFRIRTAIWLQTCASTVRLHRNHAQVDEFRFFIEQSF